MHNEDDDEALVAAAGRGDQQAFNRLVQRHAPRMHAIVRRYVGSPDDADEIVQDTFWKAWKSLPDWRPGGAKFSTWLYRVAVNRSIDHLRTTRRNREVVVDEDVEIEVAAADSGDSVDQRQTLRLMRQAINRLPDRQRLAILLSTQEEKSNVEIAQIMESSEGAIEQLLVRARKSLRKTYRELP